MKNKRFYAVSNAHLDTQWNWTIRDTIREYIKNTLEDNFRNFRSAGNYVFNFEGAFRYKLMQEYYPDHYKKMKEYVAKGMWHPSGAFWDSCDVNVPSSEALMRQALLGNKFFEKEFGIFTKDIFLPDCFGFRSSLPSIARHMGLIGFSTQKLTWGVGCPILKEDGSVGQPEMGDHNRMDLGKWQGPDGEEIFVSLNGGSYVYQFQENETPVQNRENILKAIEHNGTTCGFPWRMQYFGVGDRGGACAPECAVMVSDAAKASDGLYEVKSAYTYEIFEDLAKEDTSSLPTYTGHLMIPHGFGALTSHTISKRLNRICENLADSAEKASSMACLLAGKPYPKEELNEAWKTFLWHQFHDDITGTSVCSAYVFSHNDYAIAMNRFAAELSASVEAVADLMDTTGDGIPVVLFNPVGSAATKTVCAQVETNARYVCVKDDKGNEVPSQLSIKDGQVTAIFTASVPAVGVSVYHVCPSTTPFAGETGLSVTDRQLENRYYRVSLDENGDIASIFDKELNRELLLAPMRLEISPDNSVNWPSWELNFEDNALEHTFVSQNVRIALEEQGAARVALRITRTHDNSTFTQIVSLSSDEKLVNVENHVDWNSCNSLLKATFPLTAENPVAEFDVGLGVDKGENTTSYPYFQHCVHTWANLTDQSGNFGVAILNDCKYGMDKPDDHTLRLTLIHTPVEAYGEPDSHQDWQDFGRNDFSYAITSHAGERNGVAFLADSYNRPVLPFTTVSHKGDFRSFSLVSVSDPDVLVRAVKQEEDGNRIVLRVQETAGKDHEAVTLHLGRKILSAVETNGYEAGSGAVSCKDDSITFALGHYAPKTFAVTLSATDEKPLDGTPLPLPFDHTVTTENGIYDSIFNIAIPAELFVSSIASGGMPFAMGPRNDANAMLCDGQKIKLPQGTQSVYLLAASDHNQRHTYTFFADQTPVNLSVSGMMHEVGTWDMIAKSNSCYINRDEIAHCYTHTHDKNGDRIYDFAYIFKYRIDTCGASMLTLPVDKENKLFLFAITASTKTPSVTAAAPLYPVADDTDDKQEKHTLTVEGNGETLLLSAGQRTLVTSLDNDPEAIFDHWEGEDILTAKGTTALVRMPDHDTTVRICRNRLGQNHSFRKPTEASASENAAETPDHAVNGIANQKWCALLTDDGAWMSVDLGSTVTVDRWMVKHSGNIEGSGWNTRDFVLQYRNAPADAWITADSVVDNHENITIRDIEPIQAHFVRLLITKAAQDDNERHARIYDFSVFKK